jgi:hypothetical protein
LRGASRGDDIVDEGERGNGNLRNDFARGGIEDGRVTRLVDENAVYEMGNCSHPLPLSQSQSTGWCVFRR